MSKKKKKKRPLDPQTEAQPTWLSEHAGMLLWCGILAYVLYFGGLSVFRYQNFYYDDWDLATYNQIFRGLLHGHSVMSLIDLPYLGLHAEITMLTLLPFYAVFPHPLTLLVLQSFFLALAAFPLYLIARTLFRESVSLFFVAIYLFYPAFWFVNLNEFHPECLMPFLQFFLFYFFLKRDFGKFLIFMFLVLFTKENMPLIVIMFGVLSAIQRRPKRWIFWPVVAGMAWFGLYLKVIYPWINQGRHNFGYLYSHMGNSLPAIAWHMIAHPIKTLQWICQPLHMTYAGYIFSPVSFMSVLSPGVLMLALPIFLQHFLSLRGTETNIYYYYAVEFSAFIFIAALFGLNRLRHFLSPRKNWLFCFFVVMSVIFSARVLAEVKLLPRMTRWMRADEVRARSYETLLHMVPTDEAAVATFSFLPELSRRPADLFTFHSILTGEYSPGRPFSLPPGCSNAFVDYDDPLAFSTFFSSPWPRQNLNRFLASGPWSVREACGNAVLYQKNAQGKELVSHDVAADVVSREPFLIYDNRLAMFELGHEKIDIRGQKGVRLTFVWKLLSSADATYGFKVFVMMDQKRPVWEEVHPLGYWSYPTQDWKEGEAIKETFQFILPREAQSGPCQIALVLVDFRSGQQRPITGGTGAVLGNDWIFFSL